MPAHPEGGVRASRDLLPALERQKVERVGPKLAKERGGPVLNTIGDRQTTRGKLIGSTPFAIGHFAMIDDGLDFSLVPWRPVIERKIGREVIGVRGTDVSLRPGTRARDL